MLWWEWTNWLNVITDNIFKRLVPRVHQYIRKSRADGPLYTKGRIMSQALTFRICITTLIIAMIDDPIAKSENNALVQVPAIWTVLLPSLVVRRMNAAQASMTKESPAIITAVRRLPGRNVTTNQSLIWVWNELFVIFSPKWVENCKGQSQLKIPIETIFIIIYLLCLVNLYASVIKD